MVEQIDDRLYIFSRCFIRRGSGASRSCRCGPLYTISELTYDYSLPFDPTADDPCYCRAKNCRGSLHLLKPMEQPAEEEVELTDMIFKPDRPLHAKIQRLPKPTKDEARVQVALWSLQFETARREANH